MLVAFAMFLTWQISNDPKYQQPFQKSLEATYANSELKTHVEDLESYARATAPAAAAVLPAAYSLGIRRQVHVTSSKVTLVPGTVTTYNYDQRAQSGTINITFAF